VPKPQRTRPVSAAQARSYATKAAEFLAAAEAELAAKRHIAATSLAIHAAINAADAVTGVRTGQRAAGQSHDDVLALLRDAGPDGAELNTQLTRLLPLKTTAEYDPDEIPGPTATKAVERAGRCVRIAQRVVPPLD
jgi:HEPN domain-containing protein